MTAKTSGDDCREGGARRFTRDEVNLIHSHAATHTAQQLGDMLGRTRRSIANKAHSLGISMKKRGDNHYNVKHSEHDIELCRALFDDGMSVREISEKMEIDQPYLSNILYFHKRKPA